jgi:PAS domain S-box-containing protein
MVGGLHNLVDIDLFQTMLDSLNEFHPFPSAIIDAEGEVLASTSWGDTCTCYDKKAPSSFRKCPLRENLTFELGYDVAPTSIYKCEGGLYDCSTPIVIEGKNLGYLHTGRFFLQEPDPDFFMNKASKLGVDESVFMSFVSMTPVFTKDGLLKYLSLVSNIVTIIESAASKNLREIENNEKIVESEKRFRELFNAAPDAIILADTETGIIINANHTASNLLGRPLTELVGMHQTRIHPQRTEDYTRKTFKSHAENYADRENLASVENIVLRSDGTEIPVEIMASTILINGKKIIQGVFRDISSRKRMEAELNETEHKYQSLAENLPDIVARFDKNLRHIYVNKTIEEISGIPVSAYLGKTNEELQMPSESVLFWNENLNKVFKTAKRKTFEFTFQSGNSKRYFSSLLVPEFDHSGNVISVLTVARDITPLKKSKQSLRIQRDISIMLSEMRDFDPAMNQLLDFILQLDGIDSGGIYLVDQISGNMDLLFYRGLSDEFINQSKHFFSNSEIEANKNNGEILFLDFSDIQKQNNQHITRELIRSLAILPVLYGGKPIACFYLASHLYDEVPTEDRIALDAIVTNLGGTLHRIRIGNQLKESETKYKLAFQTSPDAININTLDGVYVDINEGFSSIMGYSREIIGKSSLEMDIWVFPEDRARLVSELKKCGVVKNLESVFRAKDGTLRTALMSANIIAINDKPHILSITRDITDRKKAENELLIAKERAEESNRLKTAFLANLSHELRTPMNGILGFAELLDDDTLTKEVRNEYISVINDSGQSLLEVITNLMDISKIDSRQIESSFRSFNLNGMLDELLKWFKSERIYREKAHLTIELAKEFTDEKSIVTSDPGKIRHIFSLLLNNAAKFTAHGVIRFGYSVHGNKLRLFVQDTGKGISKDKQQTIFERFRQEDETLSRKYGGVGLGLTIAKSLVGLIGAQIMVESELGKGSTFWFEIPI